MSFGSTSVEARVTGAVPVAPDPFDLLFPALLIAGTAIIVLPLSIWQLRPRRASGSDGTAS
jgi:hypothetical protein